MNIPVAELPAKEIVVDRAVSFFGVWYAVPEVVRQGRTVIAINLGGAFIPIALSVYLLIKQGIYAEAAIGVAIVAFISRRAATLVPGMGIAVPTLLLPIVAVLTALLISRKMRPLWPISPAAWAACCADDLLNLGHIQELGAPVVSIGGAGISDGVFLTGIVAVLLA